MKPKTASSLHRVHRVPPWAVLLGLILMLMSLTSQILAGGVLAPEIKSFTYDPIKGFSLQCAGNAEAYFVLQRSATLASVGEPVQIRLSQLPLTVLSDPVPLHSQAFYRVVAFSLSADADSDGDGIGDVYELRHPEFLNPLVRSDSLQDRDGDGFTNLEEYQCGSDPSVFDDQIMTAISGRVLDRGGHPVSGATVGAYAFAARTKTDANGQFVLAGIPKPTPAANLTVELFESGQRYLTRVPNVAARGCVTDIGPVVLNPFAPPPVGILDLGPNHAVALQSDGSLWSWGDNSYGQLGIAPSPLAPNSNKPIRLPVDVKWLNAAADQTSSVFSPGAGAVLAVSKSGQLWGWGAQYIWKITSQSPFFTSYAWAAASSTPPTPLPYPGPWTPNLCSGDGFWMLLKTDGSLWHLGLPVLSADRRPGVYPPQQMDAQAPTLRWKSIACGSSHVLGISTNGVLWAWGDNQSGEVGLGHTQPVTQPTRVGTRSDWVFISARGNVSFGITSDGGLWAWGRNASAELGDGTFEKRTSPTQVGLPGVGWSTVHAGGLGVQRDGSLWIWGAKDAPEDFGRLGESPETISVPRRIRTNETWIAAIANGSINAALRSDGEIVTWSRQADDMLGDGLPNRTSVPVQVPGEGWSLVSPGNGVMSALKKDGSLWTWGGNTRPGLGRATTRVAAIPDRVAPSNAWSAVTFGYSHAIAIRADGTLWSWGLNSAGQLGTGDFADRLTPVQISNLKTWNKVDANTFTSVATRTDGSAWVWGWFKGIANGADTNYLTPVRLPAATPVRSVAAGDRFAVSVLANGSRVAWGDNTFAQLGTGGLPFGLSLPLQMDENRWSAISAGNAFAVALKADGTLWGWGLNFYGASGFGWPGIMSGSPIQVGVADQWVSVDCGHSHTLALSKGGRLYAWGRGAMLGDGNDRDSSLPISILPNVKWQSVTAGPAMSAGIREDSSLWVWGSLRSGDVTRVYGGPVWGPSL